MYVCVYAYMPPENHPTYSQWRREDIGGRVRVAFASAGSSISWVPFDAQNEQLKRTNSFTLQFLGE